MWSWLLKKKLKLIRLYINAANLTWVSQIILIWQTICGHKMGRNLFSLKANLETHLRTHIGTKPYQGNQCDRAFSQNGVLTKHLKTHTGDKPYQCSQCDKAFSKNFNLTTHLRNILERNHINVANVTILSQGLVIL